MKPIDGVDETVPNYDRNAGVSANKTREPGGPGVIGSGDPLTVREGDGPRYGPDGIYGFQHYPEPPEETDSPEAMKAVLDMINNDVIESLSVYLDKFMNEMIRDQGETVVTAGAAMHNNWIKRLHAGLDKAHLIHKDGKQQFTADMITSAVRMSTQIGTSVVGGLHPDTNQGTLMATSQGFDAAANFGTSIGKKMHANIEAKEARDDAKSESASSGESAASSRYSDLYSSIVDLLSKRASASSEVEQVNRTYFS